jgi:hypothetical protein
VVTDGSWRVTDRGPTREADFLMGEAYDARMELGNWSAPGYDAKTWSAAVRAATEAEANDHETAEASRHGGGLEVDAAAFPQLFRGAGGGGPEAGLRFGCLRLDFGVVCEVALLCLWGCIAHGMCNWICCAAV